MQVWTVPKRIFTFRLKKFSMIFVKGYPTSKRLGNNELDITGDMKSRSLKIENVKNIDF